MRAYVNDQPDLASNWAASAWQRLGLTIPVDLEKVRRHLKLFVRVSDLGHNTGHLLKTAKRRYVVINVRDCPERRRFTIAHEIGEYLLLRHYDRQGRPLPSNGFTERFCDRFATHLLMPEQLVIEQAVEVGHGRGNRKTDVLASRFGVSIQAMRLRLRELGLHVHSHAGPRSESPR